MESTKRQSVCFVVSAPGTAQSFLRDHIAALSKYYDIYLVANFSSGSQIDLPELKGIHNVAIERSIHISADIKAVISLAKYFKTMKFDAVHSVTPKAGLITALASRLAHIKQRTHIFTGQVWATRKGVSRSLLKTIDRFIATLDNHILVDGESQRRFLINEGVLSERKSQVLGAGSICGANTRRFTPNEPTRRHWRQKLGIPDNKVVYTFMGRLNHDKGIYELLGAFNYIVTKCPEAYLLLFGNDEENCISRITEYPEIKENKNFQYYGATSEPQEALQASDIFCLPSYREGFGMSVIEASCLGIPVICSDAYGLADTIVNNVTGLRCKVGSVVSLAEAMESMYNNPQMRIEMGQNGQHRVLDLFTGEKIVAAWVDYYRKILPSVNHRQHR